MDFAKISEGLIYRDGIWFGSNQTNISYPKDGNSDFMKVEDSSFWFIHRNKCIQAIIKKFPTVDFLLDVGGGNGFVSKGLLDAGVCEVALMEPGIDGILNAKNRGVKHLLNSTLQDAKLKLNSLPAVGLFDVLEHIKYDQKFLNDLSGLIAPGGYIFITVPTFSFLWSKDDVRAGHFRRYKMSELKNLLEQSNFELCFASYFFTFLIIPIFFLKTLPSLFLKKKLNADSINNDHVPSIGRSFIDLILKVELFFLKKKVRLPFGSSCIVVAKKK